MAEMKLWLLRPINDRDKRWTYDCNFGFVVRAPHEAVARTVAAVNVSDEGRPGDNPWLDEALTSCVELTGDGPEEIIMNDYYAA